MSCIESGVKHSWECRKDGEMVADCKVPRTPVIFPKGKSISKPGVKSQVCEFLATRYPADIDEPPVEGSDKEESIKVLAGNYDSTGD